MIIKRLTIRNYRGVDEASVEFVPVGITLIEGNNEVGKSSLMEALHNIFEYTDDSGHRNIKAIRPTHRDKGPEIELEAETGPYSFKYLKRYHKKPLTELTITTPATENHTGRAAHERAEDILNETIDKQLWKAVGVQQGEGISQAKLRDADSLKMALDQAAGGDSAADALEPLFERIQIEYGKYFTGGRKDNKELVTARQLEADLEARLADLNRQAHEVESDTIRAGSLTEEILKQEGTVKNLKEGVIESDKNLDVVVNLEREIETHDLEIISVIGELNSAKRDLKERQDSIQLIAYQKDEIERLSGELNGVEKELFEETKAAEKAKKKFEKISGQLKTIRKVRDLSQKDYDYYRDSLALEQMVERKLRVDAGREKVKDARIIIERTLITEAALTKILVAEENRNSARARLNIGAPSLSLTALKALELEIDGQKIRLASGEVYQGAVADKVKMLLPDTMEMTVTPGTNLKELSDQVEAAERQLQQLYGEFDVENSSDGRKQLQARGNAQSKVENLDEIEEQNLRDLSYDNLSERIEDLKTGTNSYKKDRPDKPPMAQNLDGAQKVLQEAEEELGRIEQDHELATKSYNDTSADSRRISDQFASKKGRFDTLNETHQGAKNSLEKARTELSDEALEKKGTEIQKAVDEKQAVVGLKKQKLSEQNPAQVRALAESSSDSLKTAEGRLNDLDREQVALKSRLGTLGEEGLHEKVQNAEGELFRKKRDNGSFFRRAAAAKLLFITMNQERDAAHESYKAPFKEKIEQLGRLVFHDSFQVELTDDLEVAARIENNVRVPFESLSGGTKEQLSILARIAAAMLVSEDKPVPIIIDDALGYTDPGRLKLMGAALAQAGKTGQVIVLTCTPERYAHLGKVEIVPMRSVAAKAHE